MVDGFSSIDPSKARGPQVDAATYSRIYKPARRSSRSSSKTTTPSYSTVKINGGTVTIDGQGYSVAPELQAGFIKEKTGGSGSSASEAIARAQALEQTRLANIAKQEAIAKQAELLRVSEQSRISAEIARRSKQLQSNSMSRAGMTAQEFQESLRRQSNTPSYYFGKSSYKKEKVPEPLSVKVYDPKDKKYYLQTYSESARQALEKLKKGKVKEVFDPFLYSEKLKSEKIGQRASTYFVPQFGTISTDYPTGLKRVDVKQKTYGELQSEIEDKRDTEIQKERDKIIKNSSDKFNNLQNKVNKGSISQIEAQKILDSYVKNSNKELNDKAKIIYKKNKDIPGVYERENIVKKYGIIAGDIAGYSVSTAIAGPIGAVAYGTARGVELASRKQSKQEAFLDIGEAWGDVLTGKEVKESKMFKEAKARQSEAGMHLLAAGFSGIGSTGKIAKDIDVLRLKEAKDAPSVTIGKLYDINKQKYIKSVTVKKTPYYESLFELDAPIIKKGEEEFILGASKATSKTRFLSFSEQVGQTGWQLTEQQAIVGAKSKVGQAIIGGTKQAKTYASYGTGYVQPLKGAKGTSEFTFGGVSQDMGEFLVGKGGKAKSLRVYPEVSGRVDFLDDAIGVPLKTTLKSGVKDTSIIFKKAPKVQPDDFGLTITKTGGKSSKKFYDSLYQAQSQISVSKQTPSAFSEFSSAASQSLTPKLKPRLETVPKVPVSFQYKTRESLGTSSLYESPKVSPGKLIPKTKQETTTKTKQPPKNRSRSSQVPITLIDSIVSPKTIPKQKPSQKPSQKMKPRQIQRQAIIQSPNFDLGLGPYSPTPGFDFNFPVYNPQRRVNQIRKIKPIKIVKPKPNKKVARITGFEAALGLGPRYVEAGKRFTGFESVRGMSTKKKKKKKPSTKKSKDNWGLY